MVEAMGGVHSEHYQEFKKQYYTAFLQLRRYINIKPRCAIADE
jgi:phosphatidylinositol 3-kinase